LMTTTASSVVGSSPMTMSWEEQLERLERTFLAELNLLRTSLLLQIGAATQQLPPLPPTTPTQPPQPPAATTPSPPSAALPATRQTLHPQLQSTPPPPPPTGPTLSPRRQLPTKATTTQTTADPPRHDDDNAPSTHAEEPKAGPAQEDEDEVVVVKVRTNHKFQAHEEDELTLPEGAELIAFMQEDNNWWWGELPDGKVGIFPSNYVTVLEGDPSSLPVRDSDDEEDDVIEHVTRSRERARRQREDNSKSQQEKQQPGPSLQNFQSRFEQIKQAKGPSPRVSRSPRNQGPPSSSNQNATGPLSVSSSALTSSGKPAIPQAALKPTQRGEDSRRDWHEKRKSIMMLQEQSRTTRLRAQWETTLGAGAVASVPPVKQLN